MSDQDAKDKKKPLTLSKKLDLKNILPDSTKSGGKTVVVEVIKSKKRPVASRPTDSASGHTRMRGMQLPQHKRGHPAQTSHEDILSPPSLDDDTSSLTERERAARLKALHEAREQAGSMKQDEEERRERERKAAEAWAEEKRRQKEEVSSAEEGTVSAAAAQGKPEGAPRSETSSYKESRHAFHHVNVAPVIDEAGEEGGKGRKPKTRSGAEEPPRPRDAASRRNRKMTVSRALGDTDEVRMRSLASIKRARAKEKKKILGLDENASQKIVREVTIPEAITVQDLSNRMAERSANVMKVLMNMDMMVTITHVIDGDTAQLVAEELGHKVKRVADEDIETQYLGDIAEGEALPKVSRPPVVTVMGHVDHGKTSLLDALRQTDTLASESGGITQHIGAYRVTTKEGKEITFIDTPGHAAFTEMRARGANLTDIVVLVVAADDGIKEQTVEAINHAKAAKVPIIVAINKMDKPGADPTRVRNELLQHELVLEELGGDILSAEVSALKKLNLEKLEEAILLQAEMMSLEATTQGTPRGVVVEASLEKGLGPVATILIQSGTLHHGDIFAAGSEWGRVRSMINDHGERIQTAGPSTPVKITGFNGVPQAGDSFMVIPDESKARELAAYRDKKKRDKIAALQEKSKKENLFKQHVEGGPAELSVIIKSDAQGSTEAIAAALDKFNSDEVNVKLMHMGVGAITESDVVLATTSQALIIGFHVRANTQARQLAEVEGIEIRYYSIIYDVVDDIKALLSGLLSPIRQEKFIGKATIRKVFKISKIGTIAGCYVTEGEVKRNSKIRLLRDNVVIHEGDLKSLKRFKDEVKEVKEGYECGMSFENFQDIREGDVIECSEIEEIKRTL